MLYKLPVYLLSSEQSNWKLLLCGMLPRWL